MIEATETEKELMRHALGLRDGETIGYRNHFFTELGCDTYPAWTELIRKGFAVKLKTIDQRDYFAVSKLGLKQVGCEGV